MISRDDIERQVTYWSATAAEDLASGELLLRNGHARQGLFFVHLALEKLLKAHVTRAIKDVAPRTHSLRRLAELSELALSDEMRNVVSDMDRFSLVGRYPDELNQSMSVRTAELRLCRAAEVFQWLKTRL